MPKCEVEESDDEVQKVQTLLSQESEQDPNAAVAMSNPDSDSDACSSKLPRNAIGLKSSKKKKKANESGEESEDASACANRLLDSDSDNDKKPDVKPSKRSDAPLSPASPDLSRLMSTLDAIVPPSDNPPGQHAATMLVQSPSASAAHEELVMGLKRKRSVVRKQPEMFDMPGDASSSDDDKLETEVETGTAKPGAVGRIPHPKHWMMEGLVRFSTTESGGILARA